MLYVIYLFTYINMKLHDWLRNIYLTVKGQDGLLLLGVILGSDF